ncbi:MAG: hypothetical protein ACFFD4_38615 [Candidatus Odinarchaeota archaeon]
MTDDKTTIEQVKTKNLTALPFAVIGDLSPKLLEKHIISVDKELKKGEETLKPFGSKNQRGNWALKLEKRFEIYAEQELTIGENRYHIVLYKYFEEEPISFPFRKKDYVFATFRTSYLVWITNPNGGIALVDEQVSSILVLFGPIGSNERRIKIISKLLSELNFDGTLKHITMSQDRYQTTVDSLLTTQLQARLRIISGATDSTELVIVSRDHSDVVNPLTAQGFEFEEERRDGYFSIAGSEVYSKVTNGAGLYIRKTINLLDTLTTLLGAIIPNSSLANTVRRSSIEFELRRLFDEDSEEISIN